MAGGGFRGLRLTLYPDIATAMIRQEDAPAAMQHLIRYAASMVFAITLLGAGGAAAASFDCRKAARPIEHTICNDPTLNALDSQLQAAYLGAIDRSNHPQAVTDNQRGWIRQRDACADAKCMTAAYERQIARLSKISDEPAICFGGTTPEVNGCMAEYSHRADRELARYVEAARKRLLSDAAGATNDADAKDALAAFDTAQATWVAYRKSECAGIGDWWRSGTIRGAMFQACWQTVTKSRTMDIWTNWLGFMDDTPPLMPKPTVKSGP